MIEPYARSPLRRPIGLLKANRRVMREDGSTARLDDVEARTVLYTDGEVAGRLAHAADGALVFWNTTPIRWISGAHEVHILPNYPGISEDVMAGLVGLHDFLETYDAAGTSLASCSWSLLRATLERELYTWGGPDPPTLQEVIGGRQQATQPPGHYSTFTHLDLSAAYAQALGEMTYGGRWIPFDEHGLPHDGATCFVRARVNVPRDIGFAPLPRRRRLPPVGSYSWDRALFDREYPKGARVQSTWTLEEIRAAEAAGCGIEIQAVHLEVGRGEARQPFAPWWSAIQRGRSLDGWAGVFAKMMGNALWGRLAMAGGERRIVSYDTDNNVTANRRLPAIGRSQSGRAFDVAELVAGRVRARLYAELMVPHASNLIGVHTDGGLVSGTRTVPMPEGWRVKATGRELIFLGPQCWAYREADGTWVYKVSGIAPRHVRRAFAEMARETLRGGVDRPKLTSGRDPAWEQLELATSSR